ncbi:DUF2625 family protein [Catellatospora vulcania]|uniref:DUF2625 family protein n=1 Tax=Catellatospora vulcania TaxID=1460450 RepID=UPI001E4C661C|nr:DUF2625 family protein [Catellatospora vulcania]
MRELDELVVGDQSAWAEILGVVAQSPHIVEVLPADEGMPASCLHHLQVTTGSWLGAVTYLSGGIVVDGGWLRVLGSGSIGRGLTDIVAANQPDSFGLVVAHDVLGGVFAWAQGSPGDAPTVHYFGPDALDWQDLELGYAAWLTAMLMGAIEPFYDTLRWPGWPAEVAACRLDQGIHTLPPPWSKEGKDLGKASRRPIPMTELVAVHRDMARQLNGIG